MIKIYVHHKYDDKLFSILFHNLIPNEKADTKQVAPYTIKSDLKSITKFKYRDTDFEINWVDDWKDYSDGINIIDWWEVKAHTDCDNPNLEDSLIWREIHENLYGKNNWIVTCFRTEKILQTNIKEVDKVEYRILDILKNHKIITDNVTNGITIPNIYSPFTNMMFQWNRMISIKWFEEFKYIYDRLNHEYDLFFSVRNLKGNRLALLEELSTLNNNKIGLQVCDAKTSAPDILIGHNYNHNHSYKLNSSNFKKIEDIPNISVNKMVGDNTWDDLTFLDFHGGIEYDFMFRYLSKSKMFINDETWSFIGDASVQYLSEKTLIFLITAIPFIPTHHYALDLVQIYTGCKPHPLYDDIKAVNRDIKNFKKVVNEVMNDYDTVYKKCKQWSDEVHTMIIDRLRKENNFCDMLIDGFPTQSKNLL